MITTEKTRTLRPRLLFRSFAVAEMFTWAGLITALVLRSFDVANLVPIAGGIHGFIFLCYSASTIFVWVNQRWPLSVGFTGILLAIVPFATLPFEIVVDRKGLLTGDWRLAPGGEAPHGFIEHVQAWVLRHVILAIILLILLMTMLFITLLWLGPPVPRD